ncbi:hypothetical protein F0562_000659 [Nyssa sinensis]|uniref:J domain-containing protein n=1 Tax=Nyssa sinensis TaxID=561372 RepID=A0A5J5C0Q6_9ASTE|nr:hypothetical protein F0562_000659 [Nyssa sinensis]
MCKHKNHIHSRFRLFLFPFSPQMGREREESDFKIQLVTEICSISTRAIACVHLHHRSTIKSPFIDWYLLLRVEENGGIDIIRKQYHKLALLLHPDKNKHPKAETAFKLVSEAYACLSDDAKRRAFNLERRNSFCNECNRVPYSTCNPPINSNAAKIKGLFPAGRLKSNKFLRRLKDIRTRFKEEVTVIETCLRANTTSRKELPISNPSRKEFPIFNPSRKESPVFNPSDYVFEGYPHHRTCIYKKPESFWCRTTPEMFNFEHGRGKRVSPIFEIKSQEGS